MAREALPTKMIRYSNEDFDVTQRIAYELTESDRKNGVEGTPRYGYSSDNYKIAERAVREWLGLSA
jgi:hypothetical protein